MNAVDLLGTLFAAGCDLARSESGGLVVRNPERLPLEARNELKQAGAGTAVAALLARPIVARITDSPLVDGVAIWIANTDAGLRHTEALEAHEPVIHVSDVAGFAEADADGRRAILATLRIFPGSRLRHPAEGD